MGKGIVPAEMEEDKKATDLSGEVPPIEQEELDEALPRARDLMAIFIKTIKAFRLYPPENPSLNDFRDQLLRKFQIFLNKYHSFIFQIREYYFSFKGGNPWVQKRKGRDRPTMESSFRNLLSYYDFKINPPLCHRFTSLRSTLNFKGSV